MDKSNTAVATPPPAAAPATTPAPAKAEEKPQAKVPTPILLDGANDVTPFASKDASRYVLNGVFMNGNGTEATDGRICIRVPFVPIAQNEFPVIPSVTQERTQVIVPRGPFKEALDRAAKIKSALPILNCVRLSTRKAGSNTLAQLATTDLDTTRVIETKAVDGTFPQVSQVYPSNPPEYEIAFSAELMKRICDYALKHGQGDNPSIRLKFYHKDATEFSLSAMGFEVPIGDGRKADGVLMPMRLS